MFRALVLAPDPAFAKAVERVALESRHLLVNKTFNALPDSPYEVSRLISSFDPEVVLMESTNVEAALSAAEKIRDQAPEVGVLALGGRLPLAIEQQFDAIGVTALNGAFSPDQFLRAIKDAVHRARRNTFSHLFAFLPGKAGSGSTTVALNLAAAIVQELQKKVFVLETDLHSGVMSMLLDVKPRIPLIDALQNADSLDYSVWLNYVVQAHGVDFLLADRNKKTPLPSWMHYHQLLRFAAGRYDALIVDLPEVVNDATAELVQYAKWTFVVCTPELTSLRLADQRIRELREKGAPPDRLRVVLNRWHRSDMKPEEVAELLQHPVTCVIRNDYRVVSKAINANRPVSMDSDVGRGLVDFAKKLMANPKEAQAPPKPRFSFF
ncbi:MAG TPA: P-loop NTPase [Bryobacteraceae bacterium]|nr:P-loop NTPase [Bryobacteraceae bacterium]